MEHRVAREKAAKELRKAANILAKVGLFSDCNDILQQAIKLEEAARR